LQRKRRRKKRKRADSKIVLYVIATAQIYVKEEGGEG